MIKLRMLLCFKIFFLTTVLNAGPVLDARAESSDFSNALHFSTCAAGTYLGSLLLRDSLKVSWPKSILISSLVVTGIGLTREIIQNKPDGMSDMVYNIGGVSTGALAAAFTFAF